MLNRNKGMMKKERSAKGSKVRGFPVTGQSQSTTMATKKVAGPARPHGWNGQRFVETKD